MNENSNSSRFTSLNDYIKNTYGSTVSSSSPSNQTDALSLINNPNGEDDPSAFSGTSRATDDNSADNNVQKWTLRRIALDLSLWANIFITVTKLVAYIQTLSLSVLAALLDSILDVISQFVLNYTEKHSSMQRSSALYPAGGEREKIYDIMDI